MNEQEKTMAPNLFICGLYSVKEILTNNKIDHMLSILDPDNHLDELDIQIIQEFEPLCPENRLVLKFNDITEKFENESNHDNKLFGYRKDLIWPDIHHVEEVLKFALNISDQDNVLIHCHAGISRSTAFATIILMTKMKDEKKVFHHLMHETQRENFICPSKRIIQIADHIMGTKLNDERKRYWMT